VQTVNIVHKQQLEQLIQVAAVAAEQEALNQVKLEVQAL
jgi:hypothetical protein